MRCKQQVKKLQGKMEKSWLSPKTGELYPCHYHMKVQRQYGDEWMINLPVDCGDELQLFKPLPRLSLGRGELRHARKENM